MGEGQKTRDLWEYRTVTFIRQIGEDKPVEFDFGWKVSPWTTYELGGDEGVDMQAALDHLGAHGWELVGVVSGQSVSMSFLEIRQEESYRPPRLAGGLANNAVRITFIFKRRAEKEQR